MRPSAFPRLEPAKELCLAATTHHPPDPPQLVERRQWVRYACHAGANGGRLVAYLSGSLMAEPVRNISAGGVCLVLDHAVEDPTVTIELYNLRNRFVRTVPSRVVSQNRHPTGSFLVGAAFRLRLSAEELTRLL